MHLGKIADDLIMTLAIVMQLVKIADELEKVKVELYYAKLRYHQWEQTNYRLVQDIETRKKEANEANQKVNESYRIVGELKRQVAESEKKATESEKKVQALEEKAHVAKLKLRAVEQLATELERKSQVAEERQLEAEQKVQLLKSKRKWESEPQLSQEDNPWKFVTCENSQAALLEPPVRRDEVDK
jgi:chromosome segregation ATPase